MAPTMQVERLKKLRARLARLRPSKHRQFSMNYWFKAALDEEAKPKFKVLADGTCKVVGFETKPVCGSAACALGHAALMPEFRKLGLKLVYENNVDGEVLGTVKYRGQEDQYAGAAFFGLTLQEAHMLFMLDAYDTEDVETIKPSQVVVMIDRVLSGEFR